MALVLQHFGRLPGRMDVGRAYALLMAGDEEAGVQACKEYILSFCAQTDKAVYILSPSPGGTPDGSSAVFTLYKKMADFEKIILGPLKRGAFSAKKWWNDEPNKGPVRVGSSPIEPRVYRRGDQIFINEASRLAHIDDKRSFAEFDQVAKNAVSEFLLHVEGVFCRGRKDVFEYILSYFAMVAEGRRTGTLLIFKSAEGTGKSIAIAEAFGRALLGPDNVSVSSDTSFYFGNFTGPIAGKTLSVVTDPVLSDEQFKSFYTSLLTIVDDPYAKVRKMHQDAYFVENNCSHVILTNRDCMRMGAEARRLAFFDVDSEASSINGYKPYFKVLANKIKLPDFGAALAAFLREHRAAHPDFNPNVIPETDAGAAARQDALTPTHRFLREHIVLKQGPHDFRAPELNAAYKNWAAQNGIKTPSRDDLRSTLTDLGVAKKERYDPQTKNTRAFYLTTRAELIELYLNRQWARVEDFRQDDPDLMAAEASRKKKATTFAVPRAVQAVIDAKKGASAASTCASAAASTAPADDDEDISSLLDDAGDSGVSGEAAAEAADMPPDVEIFGDRVEQWGPALPADRAADLLDPFEA